ncbi:MAG: AMP-binding protein [Bacilli bacterium]|nr:AMP-binding protein [Bacilli bacterium]
MFGTKKEKSNNDNYLERPWLKYYPENCEHVDYFNGSLYEKVKETAEKYPNYAALEYFKNKFSYKEMIKEIDKAALAMVNAGIKENDYVTICAANCPEAIFAFYAVNKIGAIANIIHPLSSENEIKQYLKGAKSNYLFVTDFVYNKIKNFKLKKVVILPISNSMKFVMKNLYELTVKKDKKVKEVNKNAIFWNDFVNSSKDLKDTLVKRDKNDDAVILYSGGTTGKPKGVVLSNLCFTAIAKHCDLMVEHTDPGNSILSYLPIFHGFGLAICIHTPLALGLKCILIPKINAKKINKIVEKNKPNFLPVIPSLLEVMVRDKKASKNALSSVMCVLSGGDFLNIELKNKAHNYLSEHGAKNAVIRIGYGLTEVTAATCVSLVEDYKKGSIGVPFPDTLYKIVKTNTNIPADINEIGEICISGPSVMKGYLNNPNETYKAIRVHEDGKKWLHTGDLGRMDENGIFYFETRLKRMIISNGCNIYPNYLEEIYNKHPLIETSVIVGIQDDIKQQVAKAIIVLKKNIKLTQEVKDNIIEYAKKNIVKYALPKEYEYVDSIPKTPIGKVDYKKLENHK